MAVLSFGDERVVRELSNKGHKNMKNFSAALALAVFMLVSGVIDAGLVFTSYAIADDGGGSD